MRCCFEGAAGEVECVRVTAVEMRAAARAGGSGVAHEGNAGEGGCFREDGAAAGVGGCGVAGEGAGGEGGCESVEVATATAAGGDVVGEGAVNEGALAKKVDTATVGGGIAYEGTTGEGGGTFKVRPAA